MTPVRLVHLNVGGPTHVVEHAGKTWRFEEHGFFGPLVLRRDGAPVKRQPGAPRASGLRRIEGASTSVDARKRRGVERRSPRS